jgi:hypothetical protein
MPAEHMYCNNCHVMFYDGYAQKGVCPGGGGHVAIGYYFGLPYDVPATSNDQSEWRYCTRCHAMFYNGYVQKGVCLSGGGHFAEGYGFVLPHDVPETPTQQTDWWYCRKCHVLFFDGYEQKAGVPPVAATGRRDSCSSYRTSDSRTPHT